MKCKKKCIGGKIRVYAGAEIDPTLQSFLHYSAKRKHNIHRLSKCRGTCLVKKGARDVTKKAF